MEPWAGSLGTVTRPPPSAEYLQLRLGGTMVSSQAFASPRGSCPGNGSSRSLHGPRLSGFSFILLKQKSLQVEQSLCWIWEMLFLVTDKGNYLWSASSFSPNFITAVRVSLSSESINVLQNGLAGTFFIFK